MSQASSKKPLNEPGSPSHQFVGWDNEAAQIYPLSKCRSNMSPIECAKTADLDYKSPRSPVAPKAHILHNKFATRIQYTEDVSTENAPHYTSSKQRRTASNTIAERGRVSNYPRMSSGVDEFHQDVEEQLIDDSDSVSWEVQVAEDDSYCCSSATSDPATSISHHEVQQRLPNRSTTLESDENNNVSSDDDDDRGDEQGLPPVALSTNGSVENVSASDEDEKSNHDVNLMNNLPTCCYDDAPVYNCFFSLSQSLNQRKQGPVSAEASDSVVDFVVFQPHFGEQSNAAIRCRVLVLPVPVPQSEDALVGSAISGIQLTELPLTKLGFVVAKETIVALEFFITNDAFKTGLCDCRVFIPSYLFQLVAAKDLLITEEIRAVISRYSPDSVTVELPLDLCSEDLMPPMYEDGAESKFIQIADKLRAGYNHEYAMVGFSITALLPIMKMTSMLRSSNAYESISPPNSHRLISSEKPIRNALRHLPPRPRNPQDLRAQAWRAEGYEKSSPRYGDRRRINNRDSFYAPAYGSANAMEESMIISSSHNHPAVYRRDDYRRYADDARHEPSPYSRRPPKSKLAADKTYRNADHSQQPPSSYGSNVAKTTLQKSAKAVTDIPTKSSYGDNVIHRKGNNESLSLRQPPELSTSSTIDSSRRAGADAKGSKEQFDLVEDRSRHREIPVRGLICCCPGFRHCGNLLLYVYNFVVMDN